MSIKMWISYINTIRLVDKQAKISTLISTISGKLSTKEYAITMLKKPPKVFYKLQQKLNEFSSTFNTVKQWWLKLKKQLPHIYTSSTITTAFNIYNI